MPHDIIDLETKDVALCELIGILEYAKESVQHILNHNGSLVDGKGIAYWAGQVELLRKEINDLL